VNLKSLNPDELQANALQAQAAYHMSHSDKDLMSIFYIVERLAFINIRHLLKKFNKRFFKSGEEEEAAETTAIEIILMYKKKQDYSISKFKSRVHLQCLRTLFHPRAREVFNSYPIKTVDLEECDKLEMPYKESPAEQDYWDEVMLHPLGKKVILIIFNAKFYKHAIISIEKITGRKWIYSHAVALHDIFLHTRVK
jgi:hypothetical protein